MKIIADLHLHSRFSRAVSQQMTIPEIASWAKKKGIDLVATGDWTHPIWYRELKANLIEVKEGFYKVKNSDKDSPYFLFSTELSSIYSQGEKTRRIHYLIFAPSIEVVEKINREFSKRGVNILSDGRPIMGLSVKDVAKIVFEVDSNCLLIPAHAWTPWFSLYGSKSGFDSLEECFADLSKYIYAVETGLSSDPAMNWKIEELETRSILSFSDAHSPQKLGREATVFELPSLSYENVRKAIVGYHKYQEYRGNKKTRGTRDTPYTRGASRILYTIEFYPEEGKYHYAGHRQCSVVYSPDEIREKGMRCPVCGKQLTAGVMSRVEELSSREVEIEKKIDKLGVQWIGTNKKTKPSYTMLVPLIEIIAEALGVSVNTKVVEGIYEQLISSLGSELKILLEGQEEELQRFAERKIMEGIMKVRRGDIVIKPGYDGVFGKVKIWSEGTQGEESLKKQMGLF